MSIYEEMPVKLGIVPEWKNVGTMKRPPPTPSDYCVVSTQEKCGKNVRTVIQEDQPLLLSQLLNPPVVSEDLQSLLST